MSNVLTKEIAYKKLQQFFENKPFVLFGTGMSCAVNNSFGMNALEKELKEKINNEKLNNSQEIEWKKLLKTLGNNTDFETAMNNITDEELVKKIVNITANFLSKMDYKYSLEILSGNKNWPASLLFKKLVDKLPGSDRELHVATPNYDLLAEYSFERANIPYINGFTGGIIRHLDWKQSRQSITYTDKAPNGKKINLVTREHKHISLYKVHGSINLFSFGNKIIENNAWMYNKIPKCAERVIITPGISKYKKLLQFRKELLGKFDNAVEKHNAFLFLGFSFNDKQLNTNTISGKLKNQKCDGLIITKDYNNRIKTLLQESENLWLVCKNNGANDTLIVNNKYPASLILKNECLWQVDKFANKILGG